MQEVPRLRVHSIGRRGQLRLLAHFLAARLMRMVVVVSVRVLLLVEALREVGELISEGARCCLHIRRNHLF